MKGRRYGGARLEGPRHVLERGGAGYPAAFSAVPDPPARLYVIGDVAALQEGLAIVGARKATPYGMGCARRFARMAAERGVVVISGGARGCDGEAHQAALDAGAPTVVFLGGGCDELYPSQHHKLFQRIVDSGGAVASEHAWDVPPLPYMFRLRNRLIAGLAKATLIVEAGLPSGTFSTADEALAASKDVFVVPGAITSATSRGANRLIYQGATPIIDDETFRDMLFSVFGCLRQEEAPAGAIPSVRAHPQAAQGKQPPLPAREQVSGHASTPPAPPASSDVSPCRGKGAWLVDALRAEPLSTDSLASLAQNHVKHGDSWTWLMTNLAECECAGLITRYPDGRWGPVVPLG